MTNAALAAPDRPAASAAVAGWMMLLLATACGLLAANLYYAQPLVGPISLALGLQPGASGLIVTSTQVGYGLGLLLIVPLADLLENRRLVLVMIGICALALVGAAFSRSPASFLTAALFVGVGSVAVQILVPYASHLAPEAIRGRVVGNVVSGLMLGIMLARPVASFITQASSWHRVFELSAAVMVLLGIVLGRALPKRVPASTLRYRQLLASMGRLLTIPILRRRAIYHACLFAAFSLFWTTVPLLLAGPEFQLSQAGIAWFALAGVAGAIAAPIAGGMADRGWTRPATCLAMLGVAAAFLLARGLAHHPGAIFPTGGLLLLPHPSWSLPALVAAAVLLDFGVTTNLVLGQRAIFTLGAEYRGRVNGLYLAIFFAGGAVGSAVGAWSYANGGWALACWVGVSLPVVALLYLATERRA